MRGLELALNMATLVAIVVIVLIAIVAFVLSSAGSNISETDLQAKFRAGCLAYCTPYAEDNYLNTYEITKKDRDFLNACVQLGYGTEEFPVQCLQSCGNCDLTTSKEDINTRLQQLITRMKSTQ
ncbi:MAG: hypothetical protein HY513_01430 [Candidatus Aenigmarchaeota archaeon]|nr:hypothetical protein [Candidatus Aenigmarchaeota archaeon]